MSLISQNNTVWYSLGGATVTASTGSTTVTFNSPAITPVAGDLLVCGVYAQGDVTGAVDNGAGWKIVGNCYDSANTYGMLMGVMNYNTPGVAPAGFTLQSSMAWTACLFGIRPQQSASAFPGHYLFDAKNAVGAGDVYMASASNTGLAIPAMPQPYPHILDLCVRGYNNAGTTTSCGNIANWTEMFDTGQTSPPHGIVGNIKAAGAAATSVWGYSTIGPASVSSALGVAKTMRAGLRCAVPIVSAHLPQRYRSNGRRYA